jgi:aminoglycoside phosphotransferase (APT) family kinase protein
MSWPAAEGRRVAWEDVPAGVRAAVGDVCGARVVEARTQPGGFSPGVAARVRCANGARWFVKAVSAQVNPHSPGMHRREGQNLAALAPFIAGRRLPIPRLRGTVDLDPWFALVLDDVDGRHPGRPWLAADLEQVLAALDRLAVLLTPAPIPVPAVTELFAEDFTGWRSLARTPEQDRLDPWSRAHLDELAALESTWAAHAAGDTLLHSDVRADNLLMTGDGAVVVVDWPHACRGAAFVDPLFFAPSVAMQGGPELAELLGMSRSGRSAQQQSVTAIVCALAGYFTREALRPPPPGLPTLRGFQAAQGEVARRWLAGLI